MLSCAEKRGRNGAELANFYSFARFAFLFQLATAIRSCCMREYCWWVSDNAPVIVCARDISFRRLLLFPWCVEMEKDEDNGIHGTTLAALIKIKMNPWTTSRVLEAFRCAPDECKSSDLFNEIAARRKREISCDRAIWADGRLNSVELLMSFGWIIMNFLMTFKCRWAFSSSIHIIPFKVRLRSWIV